MRTCMLSLSADGSKETAELSVFLYPEHKWWVKPWPSWLTANTGAWQRVFGPTRGGNPPEYLHLCDWSGNVIMVFEFFSSWKLQDVRGGVGSILAGTPLKGRIVAPVPKSRQFRIRVNSQAGLSLGVGQTEVIVLEVEDVTDRVSVLYRYEGSGLTLSVPGGKGVGAVGGFVKRAQGVMGAGSISSVGPWNDFEVPGWICAYDFEGPASAGSPYSLGFGTETSWSTFSFGDNGGKSMVSFGNFGTGQTFGLPSAGFTTGSMSLMSQRRQH